MKLIKLMKNRQRGQSLLEMVVVIGVTGIALVAVALAATVSVKNARIARERAHAKNYALEVLEQIRTDRVADSETFFNSGTRTETLDPVGTTTQYTREVTYTELVVGESMTVTVTITWLDSGITFTVVEQTSYQRYTGS